MPNRDHPRAGPAHRAGDTRRHALHETVTDRLRRAILDGRLHPGTRLVEENLAHEYDVSRHPVREALRALQAEGLVDILPRRGATVTRVSRGDAAELFEMLMALDGLAARLAAEGGDDRAIAELGAVLDAAAAIIGSDDRRIPQGDLETLAALNDDFHTRVAGVGGNRHLSETIRPLRERIHWVQADLSMRRPAQSWAEHRAVYDAIRARNADRAEALARAHVASAREVYLAGTRSTR